MRLSAQLASNARPRSASMRTMPGRSGPMTVMTTETFIRPMQGFEDAPLFCACVAWAEVMQHVGERMRRNLYRSREWMVDRHDDE